MIEIIKGKLRKYFHIFIKLFVNEYLSKNIYTKFP